MFPTFLDTYNWYWPMHDDDDGEEGNGDVHAAQEAEAEGDEDDITGAFDLNPCQFGVPASRSRCYTVSLSSFSLHFFCCYKLLIRNVGVTV